MNSNLTPPLLTPTRLVKHRDKLVSIPVGSPKTVDDIYINDLQGFDTIISSIIKEKEDNGITFAMKLLGSYKFFYNLSDQEIQNFAYLTGIVAPYDSNKLSNIEADIYKIIFPKFTSKYQDLIDLTQQNWIDWKISIFIEYIKNGVNDSNHKFLTTIKKNEAKTKTFNDTLTKLISKNCFDETVKFNPFIGFDISSTAKDRDSMVENSLIIITDTGELQIHKEDKDNKDKEGSTLKIGYCYMKVDDKNKLKNPVRLNKHLASLLIFVDSVLNKCILKFLNENNMSLLGEFKETSIGNADGKKGKKLIKSPKKSLKKSKKNKKKYTIIKDVKKSL